MPTTEKKEKENFTIDIAYHQHTDHFFINFNKDDKYIVSIKLTEGQAAAIARDLGLKIMQ